MKKRYMIVSLLVFMITLTGCFKSEEKVMNEIEKSLKDEFLSEEVMDTNYEINQFQVYKPEHLVVVEEGQRNFVFADGDQSYVLFINDLEDPDSKWFYDLLLEENDDDLQLRSFEDENQFVYLGVRKHENDDYEVHLGIGGIKMSTLTTINKLETDVEMMMKMIKSLENK